MTEPQTTVDLAPPDAEAVRAALERRDAEMLRAWAQDEPVALADLLAELLGRRDEAETAVAAELLGDELTADVVAEMDPVDAADLLERLDPADAADVLEEMAPDDAADVFEELEDAEAEEVLGAMQAEEASELRELLTYPPDTAGGIMTPDVAAVRPSLSVEQAIAAIRRVADEAETVHYVYVTDDQERLLGVLSLRDLLLARSRQPVTAVMNPDVKSVRATDDQEQVARLFREQRYMALPVVDERDRLVGIVTVDDVGDVLEEEATEDIERLGGSQPLDEPYLHASVLQIVRKRIVWLLLLLVAQAYTATVLRNYQQEIGELVVLAVFMPMLLGIGGNVGSQTVTTLIRAVGVGDVEWTDLGRVLWKELRVALVLAVALSLGMLLRAELIGTTVDVALVVGMSAGFIVVWAGLVAAVLPLGLRRVGIDPAVVSAPLISTLVDGTGLIIYFELARRVLGL
ncbi:MAG TPA: magnesium transporter [Chloroflexota bacterium]